MLRVLYTCIVEQHDYRIVAIAALVCVFACFTAVNLFSQARDTDDRRRTKWLLAAAIVFGAGIWATHFVAELAFRPGMPLAYDIGLTAASLIVAIFVSFLGMAIILGFNQPTIGGAVVGLAIGVMHYVGMAALRAPAILHSNPYYVVASLVVGVTLSAAAFRVAPAGASIRPRVAATLLLVAAICGLHFIGMAAVWLEPDGALPLPAQIAEPKLLAVAVAAVTGVIIAFALSGSIAEDRLVRQSEFEAARLRIIEEHLARAQRIARVGSIRVDMIEGRVQWSDELFRIFGLPRDTQPSLVAFRQLVLPEDLPKMDAFIGELKRGTQHGMIEFRLKRPDGDERIVRDETEVIVDDTGKPTVQITTIRDITDERAAALRERDLEHQLQHSQRLEALGTLAGGVAHDLNNTLVPILAISKMMIEELPAGSEGRADMELIVHASEHARALVQQILAFSRQHDFVAQPVDLAQVMRGALNLMRASVPATIRIVEEIADVPSLVGDPNLLHQVVVNLVTNAAQAIGNDNGTITITLGYDSAEGIRLSIADTGCGMDGKTVNRVFEPFFTTKPVGAGAGLGLSVAHGIVTSHRGRIEVTSTPGKGSQFAVILPTHEVCIPEPVEAALAG